MAKRMTVKELLECKGKRKLVLTTAFDFYTAKACEAAGIDLLVVWGQHYDSLEEMLMVVDQVRKGAPNIMIGAGIPRTLAFVSESEAIRCALLALNAGADIIYSSGLEFSRVKAITKQRIPFVGHVGLVPVNKTWFGGLRAVGKTCDEALEVYENTMRFQDAGAIAVEMECVPEIVAKRITQDADILTFSMGSGRHCDGQFLFSCDLLGAHDSHYPRHSIRYLNVYDDSVKAFARYRADVQSGGYPAKNHVINMQEEEAEAFYRAIKGKRGDSSD